MSEIKELVDRYVEDGVMTKQEHESLIEQIHKDGVIDENESEQIARVFKLISAGELVIVDEVREKFEQKRQEHQEAVAEQNES